MMYCPLIDETINKEPKDFCKGCGAHQYIPEHTTQIVIGPEATDIDIVVEPAQHDCAL